MPDESKSELVKSIGERIRRLRKEMNLSQEQLAERSGLPTNMWDKPNAEKRTLRLRHWRKWVEG
ncbi:helix-turn-helix domain-containing protein [Paenibacillus jilunlii]|uniref:Helix-turn-helix n=1 Tax=Paenibacillus jilunlii TaxID=682956 RepID=A0A1G9TTN9_9BACL|nr:Helix-turn-helix [Paenibacillus jilunlii]